MIPKHKSSGQDRPPRPPPACLVPAASLGRYQTRRWRALRAILAWCIPLAPVDPSKCTCTPNEFTCVFSTVWAMYTSFPYAHVRTPYACTPNEFTCVFSTIWAICTSFLYAHARIPYEHALLTSLPVFSVSNCTENTGKLVRSACS